MSHATLVTGLGLLLGISSLIGIAVLFWVALRRPPTRQPSCGHCGYAVEGLEALSCPECGSDLRKVGIETPKRRMLHPGLFILLWTLLLVIPYITAFTIAMRMGPRVVVADATFGIMSTSGAMPQLLIDHRIEAIDLGRNVLVSTASGNSSTSDGVTTTSIQFPTISGASVREWTVDVRTAGDAVEAAAPSLTLDSHHWDAATIDAGALEVVFGEAPSDAADDEAEVAALLNALMDGAPDFTTTRLRIIGSNTVNSASSMSRWYAPTLVAIGAVIYGLGILVYLMLRRKRVTPPSDSAGPLPA
jgi:hypothetical protein